MLIAAGARPALAALTASNVKLKSLLVLRSFSNCASGRASPKNSVRRATVDYPYGE